MSEFRRRLKGLFLFSEEGLSQRGAFMCYVMPACTNEASSHAMQSVAMEEDMCAAGIVCMEPGRGIQTATLIRFVLRAIWQWLCGTKRAWIIRGIYQAVY